MGECVCVKGWLRRGKSVDSGQNGPGNLDGEIIYKKMSVNGGVLNI